MISVWVTHSFVGFHCWPEAPANLAYLRSPHRHVFQVKLEIAVPHGDRAIEFHELKQELILWADSKKATMGRTDVTVRFSCEELAQDLINRINKHSSFGGRRADITVTVSEDGENGATVHYTP